MKNEETNKQEFNIILYTENHVGLLTQVASIFTRRKINIESLNTSPSEITGIHRFNILIAETEELMSKLLRHLEKLNGVIKAYYHSNNDVIWQELALYKMPTNIIEEQLNVERLLRKYGARVVVIRKDYTIFEVSGHREETDNLITLLQPYGLIEFVRSARVAIIKKTHGFNTKLKEFERLNLPTDKEFEDFLNETQSEIFV